MTTVNGKRRSGRNAQKERKWRGLIAEQRRSGRTVKAFCDARGVSESLFYYWRGQIEAVDGGKGGGRKGRQGKAGAVLAPVVVVDEPSDESKGRTSAAIEIVLDSGTTVRVPADSTREQLTMVLSSLEQVEC